MAGVEIPVLAAIPTSLPILTVTTTSEDDAPYTLATERQDWISLDSATGEIRLADFKALNSLATHSPTGRKVTVGVNSRTGEHLMMVNITPIAATKCSEMRTQDLCFWRDVRYQVYENRLDTLLGPLGPGFVRQICPNEYSISYNITSGMKYAWIDKTYSLWSKANLDRDAFPDNATGALGPGPEFDITIECVVDRGLSVKETVAKSMLITVLDEDDNSPVPQDNSNPIHVPCNVGELKQGEVLQNIILKDLDTEDVNSYEVSVLEDPLNLLEAGCAHVANDRQSPHYTILHCKVKAREASVLPSSSYQINLRINDTNMKAEHGNNIVDLRINLMTSLSQMASWSRESAVHYPPHVSIFRGASPFARLAEPYKMKELVLASPGPTYSLESNTDAFQVTSKGGIVYVTNSSMALYSKPSNINVTIKVTMPDKSFEYVTITVDILEETEDTGNCSKWWSKMEKHNWYMCAHFDRAKDCERQCGLGAGRATPVTEQRNGKGRGVTCEWRGYRVPPPVENLTVNYSTCTHDSLSCPDFFCDPLEQIDRLICLQDCTDLVVGGNHNPDGLGIMSAGTKAVCTCNTQGTCTCAPPHKVGERRGRNRNAGKQPPFAAIVNTTTSTALTQLPRDPNVSAERANREGSCGPECLVGVVTGSFFLLCTITGIFLCWRYSVSGKARRDRKFVGSVASLSGVQSDYIDRTLQSVDTQNLTHDPAAPLASPDPRTVPDPKWEFPRTRLIIEQTLGEGEFGRVLRARALDIGGISGCTTVAVKTLKENANAGELNDLLSEYQLLKEVTHPNVIRLLGACTTPGAPVYLIIEFAEYGSLRNYLRKSRHLESDGQIPCSFESTPTARSSTPEPEHITTPATPRDILSFAWQISKGMAYLSDIKLVHRDLAARNVLLAAGKVCKISDFGLTRDVYEDDAYLKRSKGRVPVKWMALESLADHMYTSKSDVWSFGVLMWELVTLGASPYPGVAVHNLFHLLKAGYRMEKPDNCSMQLYNIMHSCWYELPQDRPSFKELTETFERMLEDGVEYLDLNPRIVHNRTYFSSPQDLLAKHDEARHNLSLSSTECDIQMNLRERQKSSSSHCDSSGEDSHHQATPEDEQRLLSNHEPQPSISSAGISKHLYQNELSNHSEEIPKPNNAYLTPIRQSNSTNETVNDGKLSPGVSKSSRPQSYLNMDGNVAMPEGDHHDTQQDLLFFSVENTPNFSSESSKVTYF